MKFSLLSVACALLSSTLTFASPIPAEGTTDTVDTNIVTLEKRVDHYGQATWFEPGQGNCGWWNTRNDPIVAIPKWLYDQNGGSNCKQWVQINYNGKTVYGQTVDSCPTCGQGLDLSPALFKKLDSLDKGVLNIKWNFMARGWHP